MTKSKIPIHLRVIGATLRSISNRRIAVFSSLALIAIGYAIDCYHQTNVFLTPNAAIVTALGLILTIKHHYLSHIVSIPSLISASHKQSRFSASPEAYAQNDEYVNNVISKASDEGLGLVLILLGTAINAYGSFIPLVILFK
jgi:hypothetical protein